MTDFWRLVLVDVLFLVLAGGLALWMRSLLRHQRRELDDQLARLASQTERLAALQNRLESACEGVERSQVAAPAARSAAAAGAGRGAERGPYERAWRLLSEGAAVEEVARRLGLGPAEVELMRRIQRHRQRDAGTG